MTLRNKDILEDIPKLAVLKESESGVLSGNYGKIKFLKTNCTRFLCVYKRKLLIRYKLRE